MDTIDTSSLLGVDVAMITYNQVRYISQAIESVLTQNTNFPVRIVIGDDCSTDGTREVILDYFNKYPDKFLLVFPEKNQGIMKNLKKVFYNCNAPYIAVLEGDDYWCNPNKLQLQVDALKYNPECSMSFHDAEAFDDVNNEVKWTFGGRFPHILPSNGSKARRYSQGDFARYGWFVPTASMVIRATSLTVPLPYWFDEVYSGDYTIQLLSTSNGSAIYLPQIMSRYRLHQQSIMHTTEKTEYQYRKRIHENKFYKKLLPSQMHSHANDWLTYLYFELSVAAGREGRRLHQLYYYGKATTVSRAHFVQHVRRLFGRLLGIGGSAESSSMTR